MMRAFFTAASLGVALMLAGCAGGELSASAPKPASASKLSLAGRWTMSVQGAPPCGMVFEGEAGSQQGAVHPEGGCPGKFFTSRSWQLAGGMLTIDDYQENPLATLKLARGGFKGKTTAGMPVTLKR